MKFAAIDRVALTQIGFNLFSTNDKMIGAISTQQFPSPRFSQLQPNGQRAGSTVNFSDLLNLFAFRPDLNIGATIKALQERNLLQILAEPNLITVEGKDASFLAGGQFPVPDHHHDADRRRHRARRHGAVQAVRREAGFHADGDAAGVDRPEGGAGSQQPRLRQCGHAPGLPDSGAQSQRRAETEVILKDGESFAIAGLIDNRVIETMNKVPGLGDVPILGQAVPQPQHAEIDR